MSKPRGGSAEPSQLLVFEPDRWRRRPHPGTTPQNCNHLGFLCSEIVSITGSMPGLNREPTKLGRSSLEKVSLPCSGVDALGQRATHGPRVLIRTVSG